MIKNSIEVVKFYLKNPYFLRNLIINQGKNPEVLTDTQKYFIVWNAKRLGISVEESQERYFLSWWSIKFGHSGNTYRSFNSLCYNLFQVFCSDNVNEVYKAYEMHSYMHFLRMLSYTEPIWNDDNHIVKHLESYSRIDIIDYGCGIAQISRSLAIYMKIRGNMSDFI